MKYTIGARFQVCEGSGIDSGRVGKVASRHPHVMRSLHPSYGKPGKDEVVLADVSTGEYFSMFKSRLIPVDDSVAGTGRWQPNRERLHLVEVDSSNHNTRVFIARVTHDRTICNAMTALYAVQSSLYKLGVVDAAVVVNSWGNDSVSATVVVPK